MTVMNVNPDLIFEYYQNLLPHFKIYLSSDLINDYNEKEILKANVNIYIQKMHTFPHGYFYMHDKIITLAHKFIPYLQDAFQMRSGLLRNILSNETFIYFRELIINSINDGIELIKKTSLECKSYKLDLHKLLYDLVSGNVFNLNDFKLYNWEDQFKTFLWSCKDKIHYHETWNVKGANNFEFKTIWDKFTYVKNKELAYQGYNDISKSIKMPDKYIPKSIGSCLEFDARPKNYLVGLMYNDTLNAAEKAMVLSNKK